MRHLDLFSGIGGFALAAEAVWGKQYDNVGFCDNEPFSQAILKKHWPNATIFNDIKTLTAPPTADLVTGGFPCQPFSAAGKRRGTEDDRHLWPEMLRVIRASAPRWVVAENVGGFVTWSDGMVLEQVHADLEGEGYEVQSFIIPAVAVNAPHRRDRVWIVAYAGGSKHRRREGQVGETNSVSKVNRKAVRTGRIGRAGEDATPVSKNTERERWGGRHHGDTTWHDGQVQTPRPSATLHKDVADPSREQTLAAEQKGLHPQPSVSHRGDGNFSTHSPSVGRNKGRPKLAGRLGEFTPYVGGGGWSEDWPAAAARLCAMDDGLPRGLARPKGWRNAALKGAGNAIVPQVAAEIMRVIRAVDPTMV